MSAQINTHNVAEDAHANRFANYLPLSGGTMTGELVVGNDLNNGEGNKIVNTIGFSETPSIKIAAQTRNAGTEQIISIFNPYGNVGINVLHNTTENAGEVALFGDNIIFTGDNIALKNSYVPSIETSVVNKKYVDDQIAAIPTPDVSGQIETHNTSTSAHANMHWLTADDEMLSSITPDGTIDADTLEGHPASYFATKTDLESIDLSDYVLKSELSTLVPAPDLSNYYTKTEVDAKITQIQQLIDQAAALVDQINGEVI